jgi:hypothetical protein
MDNKDFLNSNKKSSSNSINIIKNSDNINKTFDADDDDENHDLDNHNVEFGIYSHEEDELDDEDEEENENEDDDYFSSCEEEEFENNLDHMDSKEEETESNQSFNDICCLSPPQSTRIIKLKSRIARTQKKPKKSSSGAAAASSVQQSNNKPYRNTKKTSIFPSASNDFLHTHTDGAPCSLTESLLANQTPLNNAQQQQLKNSTSSKQNNQSSSLLSSLPKPNPWFNKAQISQIDPADREEVREKIDRLLCLAMKSNKNKNLNNNDLSSNLSCTAPPSTPFSSSPSHHHTFNLSNTTFSINDTSSSNSDSSTLMYNHHQPHDIFVFDGLSAIKHHQNSDSTTTQLRKNLHTSLWKELYDYFEHFNDLAEHSELIDQRIESDRAKIPQIIQDILNTNFTQITNLMDNEMRMHMKTPSDYSCLFKHNKSYIDQLCYIYWLVQDILNQIGYIESLYPSSNALSVAQPAYAAPKFDSITKTLILWYKMMTDLMQKNDLLGNFLGFTKKNEYQVYWPWFKKGLEYSRDEYVKMSSKIQEWRSNGAKINDSLKTDLINNKPERQISFVIDSSACTNPNPFLQSQSSVSSPSPLSATPSSVDFFDTSNNHLKSVKLHHLNSFLSRSSSYQSIKSNDSPNGNQLSASLYADLEAATSPPVIPLVSFDLNSNLKEENEEEDEEFNNDKKKENREKIFKEFLRKRLRKNGLKKTYADISRLIISSLSFALQALQIDKCERITSNQSNNQNKNNSNSSSNSNVHYEDHFYSHLMPLHHRCIESLSKFPIDEERLKYGEKSASFRQLGLPSFRPIYLYLNNVILELMHICIKMQIENNSEAKNASNFKYSLLSIEVLTNECRECIEQAILVRQFYYHMVS